jgi:Ca2+-transporting ATPase
MTSTDAPAGPPETPWAGTVEEVATALDVDTVRGVDHEGAAERLERYGPNEVARREATPWWRLLVDQFLSPIVYVLVAAGILAAVAGEVIEAVAVVIAVVIQAVIGFATELRAKQSVEALRELGRTTARVVRDGSTREVDGAELVPGDVVLLEEGDVVPADVRLLEVANLQVDEAALTGESEPVSKRTEPVDEGTPLAERTSMAYRGTEVTVGSGRGIVVGTGERTEIGAVAVLVEGASHGGKAPIEEQLDRLGNALIVAVAVVGVAVAGLGILVGQPVREMIAIAIALAVAAVPEGLPVVATLALARGVVRMSRRNALVKRLSAVETLGQAGVIYTDKTGTLTEGRMSARLLLLPGEDEVDLHDEAAGTDERVRAALVVASLCGNASIDPDGDDVGDPMELALQRAAERAGIEDRADLLEHAPERWEEAFDRVTKLMATAHDVPGDPMFGGGDVLVAVKGAPEHVLGACTTQLGGAPVDEGAREHWRARQDELAGRGLRVLGLARATEPRDRVDPYHDLELLGMVGLLDPPRAATIDAVEACHRAGVRVVMVTGDQPATARAIAREVGLVDGGDVDVVHGSSLPPAADWSDEDRGRYAGAAVFARLDPGQKLDLVRLSQDRGEVVGMTGDGVNDAPALEAADIGIAMGDRGTQVARDAADIVLQDDAFESIVTAIREGRTVFDNIRKFVVYLLSGNLGEILAVTVAALLNAPLPLLPLQILFINLATDVFPAAALGVVPGDESVLDDPPREPGTRILDRRRWLLTVAWSLLIGGATLGVFAWSLGPGGMDESQAVTVSFVAFVVARLLHVFNMRDPEETVFTNTKVRSKAVWAALATSGALLAGGLLVPPVADALRVVPLDVTMWTAALTAGVGVLVVGQIAIELVGWLRERP